MAVSYTHLVLSFDLIRTIISPSVSMTDGERIKIIVDLDNKLNSLAGNIKQLKKCVVIMRTSSSLARKHDSRNMIQ